MKHLFLLFSVFLSLLGMATEPTTIQGNAFPYKGQEIEIHTYLDLFTFESVAMASTMITETGSFKFDLGIEKTGLYLLKIGHIHAHLFVTPGDEYTLVITEPLEADYYNPAKDVFVLPEIYESKGKVNFQITELEKRINRFFIENTGKFVGKGIKTKADTLITQLKEDFDGVGGEFFQTHFKFRLAELEITTNHSRRKIFETYFQNDDIHYDILSYANAFQLLFDEYFAYLAPSRTERFVEEVEEAIKERKYSDLYNALGKDPLLEDKSIRELLIAIQLREVGLERKYDIGTIHDLLDSLIMSSEDASCKIIATNAQAQLFFLAPGTLATDFQFSDVIGNIYRLKEYRGRHIYIQFFDDFSPETIRQMSLMKVLKEGYGSEIAMFSISLSNSQQEIDANMKRHDFEWFFGKAVNPDNLRRAYDLRTYPSYFFLNESLEFVRSPAPSPGSEIEKLFAKIWNVEHPESDLRFKLQPPSEQEEKAPQSTPEK